MPLSLDAIASQKQYWTHIEPVWVALPEKGSVVTHAASRTSEAVLVASYQDVVLAQRWGYERIALLEHGVGQSYIEPADAGHGHPAYPGGAGRDMIGLFLSPNETAAGMDRAAYPGARVAVVGDPHIDSLPKRVPDGLTTVAVSFHWSGGFIPELKSAQSYYAPRLPELAERFHVIGHSHPKTNLSAFYDALGIEYVREFEDVCRRADLYVADNTSTLYEFASTGRPVVVLNLPTYRRDFSPGLRFWEAAGVGVQCNEPARLVEAVEAALYDPTSQLVERFVAVATVYAGWPDQHGSDRAVAAITDWLADQAVAA